MLGGFARVVRGGPSQGTLAPFVQVPLRGPAVQWSRAPVKTLLGECREGHILRKEVREDGYSVLPFLSLVRSNDASRRRSPCLDRRVRERIIIMIIIIRQGTNHRNGNSVSPTGVHVFVR